MFWFRSLKPAQTTARLTQDGQPDHKLIPGSHSVSQIVGLVLHLFVFVFPSILVRMVLDVVGLDLASCRLGVVGLAFPSLCATYSLPSCIFEVQICWRGVEDVVDIKNCSGLGCNVNVDWRGSRGN